MDLDSFLSIPLSLLQRPPPIKLIMLSSIFHIMQIILSQHPKGDDFLQVYTSLNSDLIFSVQIEFKQKVTFPLPHHHHHPRPAHLSCRTCHPPPPHLLPPPSLRACQPPPPIVNIAPHLKNKGWEQNSVKYKLVASCRKSKSGLTSSLWSLSLLLESLALRLLLLRPLG